MGECCSEDRMGVRARQVRGKKEVAVAMLTLSQRLWEPQALQLQCKSPASQTPTTLKGDTGTIIQGTTPSEQRRCNRVSGAVTPPRRHLQPPDQTQGKRSEGFGRVGSRRTCLRRSAPLSSETLGGLAWPAH